MPSTESNCERGLTSSFLGILINLYFPLSTVAVGAGAYQVLQSYSEHAQCCYTEYESLYLLLICIHSKHLATSLQHFCSHDCAEVIKSCLHLVRFTSIIPRSSQSSYHISGWEDREEHGRKTEVMKDIHRYLLCSIVNVRSLDSSNATSHNLFAGGHPDLHGNQFRNLQKALRKVIDGSIRLELDMTAQFLGHQKTLCLGGTVFWKLCLFFVARGRNREGLEIQKYLRLLQVVNILFHTILTFCTL